nr:polysaccharide deacetylase family protein [Thalassobacillus sp. CUG 92003]
MIQNDNTFYFGAFSIEAPVSTILAEGLHAVFDAGDHDTSHPGYIRLEDVHPLVEPDKVKAIADVLKERQIPYMVAVVPVYTNPETGEEHHLSDSPELLKTLKYMQNNGGSMVLHGYTHQFRQSETGEGFEFWDVEHDMPIYHGPDETVETKTIDDFDSPKAYEQHVSEQLDYERSYIEGKVTKGVQELTNYGLHPLAFEAPHYTMSQNGYDVLSDYFSTYVGQLQLSDQHWGDMAAPPYLSSPTFLNGMKLLPETMGYVQPGENRAIERMMEKAQEHQLVRDGVVAGFYHPYLGVDRFIELLDHMEQIPGIEWIDLKETNSTVKAEHVEIKAENGKINANVNQWKLMATSLDFAFYHIKEWVNKTTWGIAGIGSTAVMVFVFSTFYTRNRRLKLERRDDVG